MRGRHGSFAFRFPWNCGETDCQSPKNGENSLNCIVAIEDEDDYISFIFGTHKLVLFRSG